MSVFTALWLVWAGLFVATETVAIVNRRRGDTLSEHLRALFRTSTRTGRYVWIGFLGLLFAWLVVHIAVEGSA